MREIYAFDFDGTLTTRDTLPCFIRHAAGTWGLVGGLLCHLPWLVLMKLRLYPNWKAKQRVFAHFFKGMAYSEFRRLCLTFADTHRGLLRASGMEMLEQARNKGAETVIISASIEDWVRPFFAKPDDKPDDKPVFLCTRVEVDDEGRLTGRFLTRNCYGQEKVERLLARYPDRDNYRLTAFGDSRGDRELLALADEAHYKPFRP